MRNYIFLAIAVIVVYFIFFKKPKDETKTTTPASPSGGGTNTGPAPTNGPPYAVGETRLKLKAGANAYNVATAAIEYTNNSGAAEYLGGKVLRRGVNYGTAGYILAFNTANGVVERAFYESDLII